MRIRLIPLFVLLAAWPIAGCGGELQVVPSELDKGEAEVAAEGDYSLLRPGNRHAGPVGDEYVDEIQPLLAQRCAVCHACTNGPCQLNMTSYAALSRGVHSTNPYDFGLFDKRPTRVSDNRTLEQWRAQGFRSILPGSGVSPEQSVFYRSLVLGDRNLPSANPNEGPLAESTVRVLAKSHEEGQYSCPVTSRDFDAFQRSKPQGGMPWALPRDEQVQGALQSWALAGARGPTASAQAAIASPQATAHSVLDPSELVARWDAFLGADDLRSQLVARYIYEHAYSANLHLTENPGEFYRIVRSRTRAPASIQHIHTDRPQDDPGAGRVYYRLEKIDRVIEGKTHVPWERSLDDLEHMREQFLGPSWSLPRLPGYDGARNPFVTFEAIPTEARARFMIENSQMIYAGFARGPICLIDAASYAVDEYFWILFLDPASDPSVIEPKLGLDSYKTFFAKEGNSFGGLPIIGDKYGEPVYRAAFERTLRKYKPGGIGVQDVWDGDGLYPNAWLTVHRNQYSVDVHATTDRPITGLPKSVWLMSYANFERMYYNAVSTYKYWGNAFHQNDTFVWQILTRTEAEDMWASLFPDPAYRSELQARYTSTQGVLYYKMFTDYIAGRPSASPHLTTEDLLARELMQRMSPVLGAEDRLNNWPNTGLPTGIPSSVQSVDDWEAGLRTLTSRVLPYSQFWPNAVHVRLGGEHLYTLLAVREHRDDKIPSQEASTRVPARDYMVAVPGFVSYEAHMFVDLPYERAADFLRDLSDVRDQASWNAFDDRYKVGRNSPDFWAFVDWLHDWQEANMPVRAGLMELRMYDMDAKPF
jgi:hypothetical protein